MRAGHLCKAPKRRKVSDIDARLARIHSERRTPCAKTRRSETRQGKASVDAGEGEGGATVTLASEKDE
ncbi:hypothetical protein E2C01_061350 [Portunus trituberculatus]|uniref:Uncharacterized protein n=1 Tax=Portunus trituberculatus TaxID=210409 RepID=A0A5B7HAP7_PORTR|nr:hypothetical protein [Portunus trituberculatus]